MVPAGRPALARPLLLELLHLLDILTAATAFLASSRDLTSLSDRLMSPLQYQRQVRLQMARIDTGFMTPGSCNPSPAQGQSIRHQ